MQKIMEARTLATLESYSLENKEINNANKKQDKTYRNIGILSCFCVFMLKKVKGGKIENEKINKKQKRS